MEWCGKVTRRRKDKKEKVKWRKWGKVKKKSGKGENEEK